MANKNGGDMAINPLGAVEGDGEGAGGDGEEEDAVDVIERRRRCGDATKPRRSLFPQRVPGW